jgi:hypothetical protein
MPGRVMPGDAIPHFTPKVRSDPKFSTSLTADFAFDLYQSRYRAPSFLHRNIRKFLRYHSVKLHRSRTTDQNRASSTITPEINDPKPSTAARALETIVRQPNVEFSLPIRTMKNPPMVTRRTIRQAQDNFYNQDNATLKLDLRNIRKLLNFTTNLPEGEEERPSKRAKIEKDDIQCHCSLTIWDGRGGKDREDAGSLVREQSDCTLTVAKNGNYGPVLHISLLRPFEIEAHRLKVYVHREGELKKEMIDDYFLEVNILPRRKDEKWPYIQLLGPESAAHYSGPNKPPSWESSGALVIKYQGLPKAPDPSTPLKVFFLKDGVLFKTKSGLEVSGVWSRPSPAAALRGAPDPFGLDWDKELPSSSSSVPGNDDSGMTTRSKRTGPVVRPSRQPKFKLTYCFEPPGDRSSTGNSLRKYRTAIMSALTCPGCPGFQAKDLDELRFHFVSSHPKLNFSLINTESTPARIEATFEVTPVGTSKNPVSIEGDFFWAKKASRFDLKAHIQGDKSWFGTQKPPAGMKVDELSRLRRDNAGFLRPEHVRNFHTSRPKRYPVVRLVRKFDDKTTPYTCLTHRPISEAEETMSDSDDEVDDSWLIERHLEILKIASEEYEWDPTWLEFCRRWDKHRFEEKLEPTRYLSDSLVRFLRKEKDWLARSGPKLEQVFRDHLKSVLDARFINQSVADAVEKLFDEARRSVVGASTIPSTTDTEMVIDTTQQELPADREIVASLESQKKLTALRIFFDNAKKDGQPGAHVTFTEAECRGFAMAFGIAESQIRAVLRVWNGPPEPATLGEAVADSSEAVTKKSPVEQIAEWRAQVLVTPSNCCGTCSQPIKDLELEAVYCSLPKCANVSVLFHKSCAGVKNSKKRSSWVCKGCRAETRLRKIQEKKAAEAASSKEQKGKGRAIDPQPSAQPPGLRTPYRSRAEGSTSAAKAANATSPEIKESPSTRLNRRTGRPWFTNPGGSSSSSSKGKGKGRAVSPDEEQNRGGPSSYGRNRGFPVFRN